MTPGLALMNVILQALLIVMTGVAVWLARRRRLKRHCLVMRVAIGVQIVLIGALMAPSLSSYLTHWFGWTSLTTEIIIHHTMGAIVIVIFIFVNLALTHVINIRGRLRPYMWTALTLWLATLGLGLYLYLRLYQGI